LSSSLPVLVVFSFFLGQTAPRAEKEPRAIVQRAVDALGGLEKISQVKAVHRLSRGSYTHDRIVFSAETFSQEPGRLKILHQSRDPDNPDSRILVLEGDKGWLSINGVLMDLDEEMQARLRRARHADRVSGLTALLRDKEKRYTLMALGESQVKGKPAVGVKVSSAGQPDMSLFFDKGTGLLVKTSQRVTESRVDNEALQEWYYSDYRLHDPAAPDEALLKKAGVGASGPDLLAFLQKRTPAPELRVRIAALIKQLSAAAFRARSEATAELKKIGAPAAGLLRQALKDPDREVVRRAQQVLTHLARQKETALLPAALRLVALRRPAGAVPVLLAYLPWAPDEPTANETLAALAAVALREGKPDPDLLVALQGSDTQLRQAALAALGRDGGAFRNRPGRRVVIEGLRYPARVELYRDGKREMELEVLEVQILNRLDESVFARPTAEK